MASFSIGRGKLPILLLGAFSFFLAASAGADDITYLPSKPFVVFSVKMPDALKGKAYQEAKSKIKDFDDGLQKNLGDHVGIPAANIARITVAEAGGENPRAGEVAIITTLKPVTAAQIKANRKPRSYQINYTHKELKVGTHTVFEENYSFAFEPKDKDEKNPRVQTGQAFCVVEDKIVIIGRLESLKAILERKEKATLSAGLQAALKASSTDTMTMILDLQSLPAREKGEMVRNLGEKLPGFADVIDKVQTLEVHGTEAGKITATASITCKDAASAAEARKVADAGLVLLKGLAKDVPDLTPEEKDAMKEFLVLLDAVKLSTKESHVRAEVSVESRTAVALMQLVFRTDTKKKEFKDEEKK